MAGWGDHHDRRDAGARRKCRDAPGHHRTAGQLHQGLGPLGAHPDAGAGGHHDRDGPGRRRVGGELRLGLGLGLEAGGGHGRVIRSRDADGPIGGGAAGHLTTVPVGSAGPPGPTLAAGPVGWKHWGVSLHIGTSGWAYREWKPAFYPEGLPQDRFLTHYAGVLTACEINATFYRLQSEAAVARWAEATPADFRFAAKAHRRLTHARALPPAEGGDAFLERFLDSLAGLGTRLGAVLLQFPPTRHRDDAALEGLLGSLPPGLPVALEFRDASWDQATVRERIAAAGGTVCVSETAGEVLPSLPPGPLAYVRLRGERYSDEARRGWRELLEREAAERPVYAFAKHEGIPAGDPHAGVGLAQWLVEEVGRP